VDRIEHGRALLRDWHDGRPMNFWDDDEYLRATLAWRLGAERLANAEPALRQAGEDSAGPIDAVAGELDRAENLPRLETWNRVGERVEDVRFHPAHHEIGRLVWRSGVLTALGEPGGMTLHAALTYLFGLNGEVPHLCSIACTAGLIKAIVRSGSEPMRRDWLPRLLDPDYDRRWHAAQFLTEVQGGSDVGANACVARPTNGEGGAWRLSGEKWFCSNVGADLYAMSARPEGAPAGTAGVALFVVPRRLPDGRPNGIRIRRLKSKLGTRTLPTAEVDFDGALAWPLGRLDEGFKLMLGVIINTSRVEVAIGSAGMMRRAFVEASRYARVREAFGHRLVAFPAVRQQLAEMCALATAALASTLWVTSLEDRLTRAGVPPEDDALFRTAVNINKYVCSSDAALVVHHAIEVLGGNGTIEDFSPLPRLYREVPVQESWEGPHNTLMAQVLRDALRAKMHDALLGDTEDRLLGLQDPGIMPMRSRAMAALDDIRGRFQTLLRGDLERAAWHVRPLVGRLARLVQVSLLLEHATRAPESTPGWLPSAAQLLLSRWVEPASGAVEDEAYVTAVTDIVG
jgi:alkylation response protein AidB-like acyl-CoA dehydrogenase